MDAVEYVKTLHRLCKSKENGCCIMDTIEDVEKAVLIVEQWAKDHPVKTRQSEFLKMFPNAPFSRGVVNVLPCSIDIKMRGNCLYRNCYECRRAYWLTEVTDNGND